MKRQEPKRVRNNIVTKSNHLVRYNKSALTLQEKKFINYAISRLDESDLKAEDFPQQTFTVDEYCDTLGIRKDGFYEEMASIARSLLSKPFEIDLPNYKGTGKHIVSFANWFQTCRYNMTDGNITVKFHEDIKTYFLQLEGQKTTYRLTNTLFAKKKYMPDWYELFRSYISLKNELEMTVGEIRNFLLISNEKYQRNNDFVKYCVIEPIEELNKITDISVNVEKITKGRKIVSFKFNFKDKTWQEMLENGQLKLNGQIISDNEEV